MSDSSSSLGSDVLQLDLDPVPSKPRYDFQSAFLLFLVSSDSLLFHPSSSPLYPRLPWNRDSPNSNCAHANTDRDRLGITSRAVSSFELKDSHAVLTLARSISRTQKPDLTIKCGSKEHHVHKIIMTSSSTFFDKACNGPFKLVT